MVLAAQFATARRAAMVLAALAVFGAAACNGCRSTAQREVPVAPSATGPATFRLYAVSNLAGALEPCGCTQHQLGGVDHLGGLLALEKSAAQGSLLVAVGPTLFLEPKLEASHVTQDKWKAEAIGASLGELGLSAFTPGYNDWAAGGEALGGVVKAAGTPLIAANLQAKDVAFDKGVVRQVAGVQVGIAGVSAPTLDGTPPSGLEVGPAIASMKAAVADLRARGAQVFVGLAALPRGEALRLAEAVPELAVLVVGKPSEAGDSNDAPPPPVLLGSTLVIQTSNHLQTVAAVDFFVQNGDLHFQDGTGVANAEALASLEKRMHDLEVRIAQWAEDPNTRPEDLKQRKQDLDKLKSERERLSRPVTPAQGSFFRYALLEVRPELRNQESVQARMGTYYRRVNEHNREAFAGRKPPPLARGDVGYVGVEVCSTCHEEERKVWDRTAHAHAYATLAKQSKEYNLDCVSCHVTGYEKPGGSTVTMNASLRDVQCEQCHGPGQAHAKKPEQAGLITRDPKPELCTGACHHPPHVEAFDAVKSKALVLGPGHGMPDDAPWPAWMRDGGAD
jgi:hypothetical protein